MADKPVRYNGKGFSLRGEKNRFMLPASLRKDVIASSGGERLMCLVKHDRWPCLTGFGLSRVDTFDDFLDRREQQAIAGGKDFDRDVHSMLLYGYEEVPFDQSGRFVLSEDLREVGPDEAAILERRMTQVSPTQHRSVEFAPLELRCPHITAGKVCRYSSALPVLASP